MSPDKYGSGAGKTGVIFLFSCPGTDWLCPSQPIRLSLCVQEELTPGRQTSYWNCQVFLSFFLCATTYTHTLILRNYDSWSFAFNHKNQSLRLVLDFLYSIHIHLKVEEKLHMTTR